MEWKLIEPVIRSYLVSKYVPPEPVDPLVWKVTALYWLFKEVTGQWRTGKRLTFEEKTLMLQLLWNFAHFEQKHTQRNENKSSVLIPHIETLSEQNESSSWFDQSRETVPHAVDVHDVALCETSDEEEYDTNISSETAEQIAQLVLACKEFQLKVA
jgi:uncharacterized protein YeaC (DUF1315 family)